MMLFVVSFEITYEAVVLWLVLGDPQEFHVICSYIQERMNIIDSENHWPVEYMMKQCKEYQVLCDVILTQLPDGSTAANSHELHTPPP